MKRFGLRKRSAKPRHQLQRPRTVEQLEERSMMALIAAGNEFLINSASYGGQQVSPTSPSVSVNAAGDFLVTYDGYGAGDRDGVFARRFDATGAPLGESILANITISGEQGDATSALATNGDFVVVWSGRGPGDSSGIFARRFTSSGNSGEILVNGTTGGEQQAAAIAMAANRSFVVAWSGNGTGDSQGIFLRRFSAAGVPLAGEVRVNTTTMMTQNSPSISMADDGSFVVTWGSQLQDGSGWGVFAQRFNSQGVAQGSEFRVNTTTADDQLDPQVAMAPDGRFVIAWTGLDGSGSGIFAQQFSAAGAAVGSEVRINSTTGGNQFDPNVAINARGVFTVSWTSLDQDGSGYGIFGQNFFADGQRDGSEFLVNGLVNGHQHNASVGADDLGNFVFAWNGMGSSDGRGVQARRFMSDRDVLPPVITASLANDTGLVNNDRITRDPTVNVNVDDQGFVARLQASLWNRTVDIDEPDALIDVNIPNNFRGPIVFDRARLEQLRQGTVPGQGILPDGDYRLRLQATDEEGNVSGFFDFDFVVDTIAPVPPGMFDLLAADDSGTSNTDNLTNVVRPAIRVSALSGHRVELFANNIFVGSAIVPVSGLVAITPGFDLAEGQQIFAAKVIDHAGNESAMSSETLTITIDTTPPTTPGTPDLLSDSGMNTTDNVTNDNTPTFQIATQAGARVRVLVDGVIILAEGVATGSTIELTPTTQTIADGIHQITAVTVDDAGNTAASAALTVTIDTMAPAPNAVSLSLAPGSNTGTSNADNVTRDTTPTIRVTAPAGDEVRLTRNNNLVQAVTVGASGIVDIDTGPLPEGTHDFSVVALDPAGNAGTPRQLQIIIDSIRIDLVTAADTGVGTADNLTSQNLATLQVTASPMSSVSITIDGNLAGTQVADATGVAVFVTPLLSDGVHIVRATAVDEGGGINRVGRGALALTIDSANPTVATPIADVTAQQDAANTTIPLAGVFADVDSLGTVVRFNTSAGIFDVQLYDDIASSAQSDHVANFLNYISDYTNSIFHRVVPGFVAQGGQLKAPNGAVIQTDPPVTNEFLLSNSVGTIALARTSVVNSGTSQFFFNLTDTSDNLNNQNEGFTAFGQILANGLSALTGLPAAMFDPNESTAGATVVNSVTVLPPGGDRLLTYSIINNSNASLVVASINNGNVVLDYQPGQSGTANITVRAFDLAGNFVDDIFTVTVNPGGALMSTSATDRAPLDPVTLANLPATELSPEMAAVVAEAVRRWTSAGLDAAGLQSLQNVSVKLADLPDGYLGYALADTIWLDSDADGHSWFVDPTAGDDLEFTLDVAGQLRASDGDAAGRIDLLSVAAHELGHVLGLSQHAAHDDFMADSLPAGMRQLPAAALVDALLSGDL